MLLIMANHSFSLWSNHSKKNGSFDPFDFNGRDDGIRTHDLLHPIQAHYQAVLRPDWIAQLLYHTFAQMEYPFRISHQYHGSTMIELDQEEYL